MRNLSLGKLVLAGLICLVAAVQLPILTYAGHVITTDYSIFGELYHFQEVSPYTATGSLATIPGDAIGREYEGLLYVVGRGGSNVIQILDPSDGYALVREFSIGSGRNPQDIALIDESIAYVSCYDEAVLLKVDLDNGVVLETFSTASFADADGLPETAMMRFYDDQLFITCQLLDRGAWYAPTGPGKILVFDITTEQWVDMDAAVAGVQPISLLGSNPNTDLVLDLEFGSDAKLLVGCVGNYGVTDGGIELVNLSTGLSEGFAVTEADLGGDLTRFARGETGLYAIVADGGFNTAVKFINDADGFVSLISQGSGFVFSDVAIMPDDLRFLADRTVEASGLRVFDAVSFTELTTNAINTGLAPATFVLELDNGTVASPVIPDISGSLMVGYPYPNPCNPASILPVTGPEGTSVEVKVVDMRGHSLRTEHLVFGGNGQAEFRFSGIDRHGRGLPAGQYRIIIEGEQGWVMRSVTLIK